MAAPTAKERPLWKLSGRIIKGVFPGSSPKHLHQKSQEEIAQFSKDERRFLWLMFLNDGWFKIYPEVDVDINEEIPHFQGGINAFKLSVLPHQMEGETPMDAMIQIISQARAGMRQPDITDLQLFSIAKTMFERNAERMGRKDGLLPSRNYAQQYFMLTETAILTGRGDLLVPITQLLDLHRNGVIGLGERHDGTLFIHAALKTSRGGNIAACLTDGNDRFVKHAWEAQCSIPPISFPAGDTSPQAPSQS